MRLKKIQKEALLAWIAEGLRTDEINERAAAFDPPFSVSRRQKHHYRHTRQEEIDAIIAKGEHRALNEGLAQVAVRVERLKRLAELLELDILEDGADRLWVPNTKSIGSGDTAQVVDYEEFNKAEIDAWQGLLDDIARELGHRKQEIRHSGGVKLVGVDPDGEA